MRLARLDGIRAVAVALVFFLHHFVGERTGWVGVDLFFVLSGYLITTILLRDRAAPHYWKTFYLKRATRILPPMLLLFLAAVLLTHHLSWQGVLGYALFFGNVMDVTNYQLAPFIVLWSLAIEEHFYILWPFLTRYCSIRTLARVLLGLIIIEPIARMGAAWLHWSPMMTYYLTPFRLDGLACGAMLALVEQTGKGKDFIRRRGGFLASAGWVLLFFLALTVPSFTRQSGSILFNGVGYTLAAWASMATIGYVAWRADSPTSKLLSLPGAAWIGRISYGIYLYHGMVLSITRHLFHVPAGEPGVRGTQWLILVDIPLTLLVSWASFRFLETPILLWGHLQTQRDEVARSHRFA